MKLYHVIATRGGQYQESSVYTDIASAEECCYRKYQRYEAAWIETLEVDKKVHVVTAVDDSVLVEQRAFDRAEEAAKLREIWAHEHDHSWLTELPIQEDTYSGEAEYYAEPAANCGISEGYEVPVSAVNHPKHYTSGAIETIDYIESLGIGDDFCLGNAIKYLSRYRHKGTPLEDLRKARWYLDRLISKEESKCSTK